MGKKRYFKGKNAIITGAASGIGRAFAIELAKLGTNLVLSDINMERLESVKVEVESLGIKVIALNCNVTKQREIKKMAEISISEFKDIHFVFSNAGIAMGGPFEHFNMSQWKRIINLNLWSVIYTVNAFIPKMLEQGFGHVIVTASIAGSLGTGGLIPYSTTKFANSGFCEALYGEYKQKGIDVSVVCPFPMKTNLIETVGISFPPDLAEGYDAEVMQKGIEEGKAYYWNEFTKKKGLASGFLGGFEVDRAIKIYLKKISKRKLYVFERRYGRFFQFLRGFSPSYYKKVLNILGKRHMSLIERTIDKAIEVAEQEKKDL